MNRLHQLKQTLLQNIRDNEDYAELEFIVLDYNSEDGMEEWVKVNLSAYINTGRVIYYKTTEPKSWSPSHSKNLAFKLATGDILCSIWADYYTGTGFASYVNQCYQQDDNIVLTPIDFYKTKKNYNPPGDVLGKVCVKKTDFLKIKGFDERMDRHGFEDYDFINRLEMIGVRRVLIEDFKYLQYISHSNEERYALPTNLKGMYVNYIAPSVSEVLFLYNDQRFDKGTLIDNFTVGADDCMYAFKQRGNHFEYTLKETDWQTGIWQESNDTIMFFTDGGCFKLIAGTRADCEVLAKENKDDAFYNITSVEVVTEVLTFKHFFFTRSFMEESLKNKTSIVNSGQFGKATLFKNFHLTSVMSE